MATFTTSEDLIDGVIPTTKIWAGGYLPASTPFIFSGDNGYNIGDLIVLMNGDNTVWRNIVAIPAPAASDPTLLFNPAEWELDGVIYDSTESIVISEPGLAGTTNAPSVAVGGLDLVIVTNQLGGGHTSANQGEFVLENSTLNIIDPGGPPTAQTRFSGSTDTWIDFNNVQIIGDLNGNYATWGDWTALRAARWILRDVTFGVDLDTTQHLAALSIFTGNITTDSVFDGVSLWNGLDGVDARGAVWQTSSLGIYNGVVTPPAGINFGAANVRVIHRFANSNDTHGLAIDNHTGCAPGFDFRSVQQIDNSNYGVFITGDSRANVAFVNWLPGVPANAARIGFKKYFAGGGYRYQVYVATNPTTANVQGVNGEHIATFSDAQIATAGNAGIFVPDQEAWNTAVGPDNDLWDDSLITSRFIDMPTNGLYFRNQKQIDTSSNASQDASATQFASFVDLSAKSYRKYSWLQQETNTDFGRVINVAVVPNDATDAQVETARAGGFDLYNGTTFETSTDISDAADAIVAETGHATVAAAGVAYGTSTTGVTATERTADDIAVMSKLLAWGAVIGGGVNASNDRVNLPHSVSGTELQFSTDLTFDSADTAPAAADLTAQTLTDLDFPSTDITSTDLITSISSTGDITLAGTFGSGTSSNKVSLTTTASFTASGDDYDDLTISGNNVSFSSAGDITITNCTIDATTVSDLGGDTTIDNSTVTTTTGNIELPDSGATYLNNPVFTSTSGQIRNFPVAISGVSLNGEIVMDTTSRTFTNVSFGPSAATTIASGDLPDNSSFVNCTTSSNVTIDDVINFNIDGGEHAFTLTNNPTANVTWEFDDLTDNSLNITLPTAAPTVEVTVQVNNGDSFDEATRWLTAERHTIVTTGNGYRLILAADINVEPSLVAGTNGKFIITEVGGSVLVDANIANGVISSYDVGSATNLTFNTLTDTDYIAYYKLDSSIGSSGTVYRIQTFEFNPTTDLIRDVFVEPLQVLSIFTENSSDLAGVSIGFGTSADVTIDGVWSATTATSFASLTNNIIQGAVILGCNDESYLDWHVSNEHTVDYINYTIGSVVVNAEEAVGSNEGVVFTSSNSNTQTIIVNVSGFLTRSVGTTDLFVTGTRQVISQDYQNASITTVIQAISGQFEPIEQTLDNVADGVGWWVNGRKVGPYYSPEENYDRTDETYDQNL